MPIRGSPRPRRPGPGPPSFPTPERAQCAPLGGFQWAFAPYKTASSSSASTRRRRRAGGIIIPDSAKEKPQEGKVIAVGKGKVGEDGKVQPLDVKKGDKILFSKYAGTEINIEGDEHLIIREDDVLGVVE